MVTAERAIDEHVARTGNRVIRARDLPHKNPTLTLRPLAQRQAIMRVSHGYYLVAPDTHRGRPWRPPVEAIGLGIAIADYGRDGVALMGPSAARLRGHPSRALATGVIAFPKTHRDDIESELGRVHFVSRDVSSLDLERARTEVVEGWATTQEQTILDVATRPTLGGITPATAGEIVTELAPDCDWEIVVELAVRQRHRAALARASWLAAAVRDVPPVEMRRPVPPLDMAPASWVDPARFGIAV